MTIRDLNVYKFTIKRLGRCPYFYYGVFYGGTLVVTFKEESGAKNYTRRCINSIHSVHMGGKTNDSRKAA